MKVITVRDAPPYGHAPVLYETTKILMNQFYGKHSEIKGYAKQNMMQLQHVHTTKLNKCTPVY